MVRRDMALVHKVSWDRKFLERSPWFWPIADAAQRFEACTDWPTPRDFEALCAERAAQCGARALRFVPNIRKQDKRDGGRVALQALYDARISEAGEVPTRERDWHDFFNMLCFATFPRAKQALHQRQYENLKRRITPEMTRMPGARTPEQDALTLLDEGGAIVVASEARARQLAALGDDLEGVLANEPADSQLYVVPFGHALFEHLVEGLMMPGSRVYVIGLPMLPQTAPALLREVDRVFAGVLADPQRMCSPREQIHVRLGKLTPRVPGSDTG